MIRRWSLQSSVARAPPRHDQKHYAKEFRNDQTRMTNPRFNHEGREEFGHS
jgi:hypothetical protein